MRHNIIILHLCEAGASSFPLISNIDIAQKTFGNFPEPEEKRANFYV